jgi:hypothetical protein
MICVEDQASRTSYDLVPSPTPSSPVSKLSLFLSLTVPPVEGKGGGGAESYDCEKVWSSINHIILSRIGTGMKPKGKGRRILKICSHLLILLKISNIFVPFFAPLIRLPFPNIKIPFSHSTQVRKTNFWQKLVLVSKVFLAILRSGKFRHAESEAL